VLDLVLVGLDQLGQAAGDLDHARAPGEQVEQLLARDREHPLVEWVALIDRRAAEAGGALDVAGPLGLAERARFIAAALPVDDDAVLGGQRNLLYRLHLADDPEPVVPARAHV